jgi:hypothetical protein
VSYHDRSILFRNKRIESHARCFVSRIITYQSPTSPSFGLRITTYVLSALRVCSHRCGSRQQGLPLQAMYLEYTHDFMCLFAVFAANLGRDVIGAKWTLLSLSPLAHFTTLLQFSIIQTIHYHLYVNAFCGFGEMLPRYEVVNPRTARAPPRNEREHSPLGLLDARVRRVPDISTMAVALPGCFTPPLLPAKLLPDACDLSLAGVA